MVNAFLMGAPPFSLFASAEWESGFVKLVVRKPIMCKMPTTCTLVVSLLLLAIFSGTTASTAVNQAVLQMSTSRSHDSACSASLSDGRSLVTGGNGSAGPLATAKYFERGGQFTSVAPMLAARTDHICIALEDGTVLVAGGNTGKDGVTNAAEIFHPDSNTWTPTGPMLTARRGAATVLLKGGTALVVGGDVAGQVINTLEFYNPVAARFDQAPGVLSAPRTRYALTVLTDGRVLIAGGFEGGRILDSIDVFDPTEGISYAGRMSAARANFTATTLSNGNVLFAGGTDGSRELASAELYDPLTGNVRPAEPLAAARQNHLAVRSMHSDAVLIFGGTSAGRAVDLAEAFLPERNAFEVARDVTGEDGSTTITIGTLNPNATVRMIRTYRLPTASR